MLKILKGKKTILLASLALVLIVLGITACGTSKAANLVKATWVKPQISGTNVSISVSDITSKTIVHFPVKVALGEENFMAYTLGDKLYVRANVCPPCRSIGFSLSGDRLVCDTCKTVFNAKTGEGISGACVSYPKAAVAYQNTDGKLVMKGEDLVKAYQNTLEQGWP
ncbi:MAG: Fe-S-containing protein [Dehalococcoidales bacterium]|nr:Fe-S-containing protein [Dehalococcoidales bacterium]